MKELSIEEKAKRYDKISKEVKDFFEGRQKMYSDVNQTLECLLPELAKSENEKIKKYLLTLVNSLWADTIEYYGGVSKDQIIAWLEKQGEQKPNPCDGCINRKGCINCENGELRETEQKPTDKVEPKFKVGDTIRDPEDPQFTYHIKSIEDGKYIESDDAWVLIKEADEYYEIVEQKNSAWSEDDKNFMYDTLSNLTELKDRYGEGYGNVGKCIAWLKSLRPQNTWKPSDEQTTIKEGDKVKIHCSSKKFKELYDNKIGKVLHVWNLDTNYWGNIVVITEGDNYQNCFLEEELELLKD